MHELQVHPSVELAWVIANREASLAGCDCISPAYVLLGVLKILDENYDREAESINLDEEGLQQINEMIVACRPLLHLSERELTMARRGLHLSLHDNNSDQMPTRVRMLQWSGEALYLHQKTVARAFNSKRQTITLTDLLEELLDNLPPEAAPFFQNHPTARAAESSSGEAEGQVKYDSLLWRSSREPDKPDEDDAE
jgi:hypothetical protein